MSLINSVFMINNDKDFKIHIYCTWYRHHNIIIIFIASRTIAKQKFSNSNKQTIDLSCIIIKQHILNTPVNELPYKAILNTIRCWQSAWHVLQLGIKFYLFVSHGGMNYRGSTGKFRNARSLSLSYLHEKQTSRIQSLYLYFIKIVPFWLRNICFLIQNTLSLFHGGYYSSLHRLMSLHGKMDVKIFLMFIVAKNTGSVNIVISS